MISRRTAWMVLSLIVVATFSVTSLMSCNSFWQTEPKVVDSAAGHVDIPSANNGKKKTKVVLSGRVDLLSGISLLYPLRPGRVEKVLVQEGAVVKEGTVLLELDEEAARYQLAQAHADLKAAKAQLALARRLPKQQESKIAQQKEAVEAMKQQLGPLETEMKLKKEAYEQNLINENLFANVKKMLEAKIDQLKAGIRAEEEKLHELKLFDPSQKVIQARANVEAKEAQLKQAEYALDQHKLRAPFKGKVLRINVSAGDALGSEPREPAVLFAPEASLIVRVDVEQEFASQIDLKDKVMIEDYANPEESWSGHVFRMGEVFLPGRSITPERFPFLENNLRTLECLVSLDSQNVPLRVGQRVRVTVLAESAK